MRCRDGPSEYLFDSGTNGTYSSVIITRLVKLAAPNFLGPGSIWNLSFIKNSTFFKGGRRKSIYLSISIYIYKYSEKNTVKNGYYWR